METILGTIKIGVSPLVPFISNCVGQFPENCSYPGIEAITVWKILAPLKRPLKFVLYDNYDLVRNAIISGEIDVTGTSSTIKHVIPVTENCADVEATVPIAAERPVFLVRRPHHTKLAEFIMLNAMDYKVWLVLTVSTAVGIVIGAIILKLMQRFRKMEKPRAYRISSLNVGLCVGLILSLYANLLAIALAKPSKIALPFRTLEELSKLLKHKKCHLISYEAVKFEYDEIFPNEGKSNLSSVVQRMWEANRINPPIILSDTNRNEMLDQIAKSDPKQCLVGVDFFTNAIEEAQTQFCNIEVIIDENLRQRNFMNLVRKDSDGISEGIKAAFAAGSAFELYIRMMRSYFHYEILPKECATGLALPSDNIQPFTVEQVADSFYILGLGLAASGCLLIAEMIQRRLNKTSIRF